jgi:hypothetical protein
LTAYLQIEATFSGCFVRFTGAKGGDVTCMLLWENQCYENQKTASALGDNRNKEAKYLLIT